MSHADKREPMEPAAISSPPKACEGCSGLQPSPSTLADVEDMGGLGLEIPIRKANNAQRMLTDILEQLTELQASHRNGNKHKSRRGSNHKRCYHSSSCFSSDN